MSTLNDTVLGSAQPKGTNGAAHAIDVSARPGESFAYDLVKTVGAWPYIIVNATTQVKAGPGLFGGVRVSTGTATMTFYDGTSTAGQVLRSVTVTPGTDYLHDPPEEFQIGLYATLGGGGTVRVQVR